MICFVVDGAWSSFAQQRVVDVHQCFLAVLQLVWFRFPVVVDDDAGADEMCPHATEVGVPTVD